MIKIDYQRYHPRVDSPQQHSKYSPVDLPENPETLTIKNILQVVTSLLQINHPYWKKKKMVQEV